MTDKNVQMKDVNGNLLFPKTKAAVVYNNSNESLGGVEAGAQVNKIEKIKLNGTELTISSKEVNIVLPAAAEYSIAQAATAETGYSATYHLTKDGVNVGAAINIPKDMVVQSGSVKTCTTADDPVEGYVVGDKYIDLLLANATNQHIYIKVTDLIDVYTAGNGLTLSNGQFAVNTSDTNIADAAPTASSTKFAQSGGVYTALAGKQDTIDSTHKLDADLVDDSTSTNKFVTTSEKSTWSAKQDAIDSSHKLSADLVAAGSTNAVITLTEKSGYDGLDAAKADKATTLAGYGITDGVTFDELV